MKTKAPELDKDLFRQTFSKVKASPDTLKEAIKMTEMQSKPKKFILRRLAVAALVLALAVAVAMGANAATNGEFFKPFITLVTSNEDGSITMEVSGFGEEMPDGGVVYTFSEDVNGGKGVLSYKDKDGNFVEQEVGLSEDAQKEMGEDFSTIYDVESEARSAAEAD